MAEEAATLKRYRVYAMRPVSGIAYVFAYNRAEAWDNARGLEVDNFEKWFDAGYNLSVEGVELDERTDSGD